MANVFADTSDTSAAARPPTPEPAPSFASAPKLHEPNAESRARGYLRGAVVRWNGSLGIVVAHDSDGDPWVDFGGIRPETILAQNHTHNLERPAEPAPAPRPQDPFAMIETARNILNATTPEPPPSPASDPIEIMRAELGRKGYWLGSIEMLERAYRVTGGDASRAVDLLLLILR